MNSDKNIHTIEGLKAYCKDHRNFDAYYVLTNKIKLINKFFKDEELDTAVVGLSGGVDSSLVYYLLLSAASYPKSPIKKVMGTFMPIKAKGITGQDAARFHYDELINSIPKHWKKKAFNKTIDLSHAANAYYSALNVQDPWTCGQVASIVRTPALYGVAAQLQANGHKSIVVGTTNRDEGAYIGFFGKASDGMVDLQPLGDLHKSEVCELSKILNVPSEIINRPPEGDVWNDVTDEELFGAPYWFLELYQGLLENNATYLISYIKDCPDATKWAINIELAHSKNAHKYKVGSPARYVDVMKRNIF
jgi:NAD+ synthetase